MGRLEENMRQKRRVNKVMVNVRVTREQVLKIEHFAIENEIEVAEAHRRLLERGFASTENGKSVPVEAKDRLFFEHRIKWVDPDGELGLNLEPEGETELEQELRMNRQAEEDGRLYREKLYRDKFGPGMVPTSCAHCTSNDFQFKWTTAEEPHVGICHRNHRSYIQDYFRAGTAESVES